MSRIERLVLGIVVLVGIVILAGGAIALRRGSPGGGAARKGAERDLRSDRELRFARGDSGPRGRVTGEVRDAGGAVCAGVKVKGLTFDGEPRIAPVAYTGRFGRFSLDLAAGDYSLWAEHPEKGSAVREGIRVDPEAEVRLAEPLALRKGATLPFLVQDPAGNPLAGAVVQVRRLLAKGSRTRFGVSIGEWRCDAGGRAVTLGLLDGRYQALFRREGYVTRTEFFRLEGGRCSRALPWAQKLVRK